MSNSMIGYELNERYCQISYYHEENQEPQTLETIAYSTNDLYRRAVRHESDEVVHLLREFIEKSLSRFESIGQIVFTVPKLNVDIVRMLKGIAKRMGIDKDNVYVQDYKESFCNFMIYQPKELWQYEAALFHCDRHEVKAYMLRKLRTGYGKGRDAFITVDEVARAGCRISGAKCGQSKGSRYSV